MRVTYPTVFCSHWNDNRVWFVMKKKLCIWLRNHYWRLSCLNRYGPEIECKLFMINENSTQINCVYCRQYITLPTRTPIDLIDYLFILLFSIAIRSSSALKRAVFFCKVILLVSRIKLCIWSNTRIHKSERKMANHFFRLLLRRSIFNSLAEKEDCDLWGFGWTQ